MVFRRLGWAAALLLTAGLSFAQAQAAKGVIIFSPFPGAEARGQAFKDIDWQSAVGGNLVLADNSTSRFQNAAVKELIYLDENFYRSIGTQAAFRNEVRDNEVMAPIYFENITSDQTQAALKQSAETLQALAVKFPNAAAVLNKYAAEAEREADRYHRGERKYKGAWMNNADYQAQWKRDNSGEVAESSSGNGSITILTNSGKEYKGAKIMKIDSSNLTIMHDGGVSIEPLGNVNVGRDGLPFDLKRMKQLLENSGFSVQNLTSSDGEAQMFASNSSGDVRVRATIDPKNKDKAIRVEVQRDQFLDDLGLQNEQRVDVEFATGLRSSLGSSVYGELQFILADWHKKHLDEGRIMVPDKRFDKSMALGGVTVESYVVRTMKDQRPVRTDNIEFHL